MYMLRGILTHRAAWLVCFAILIGAPAAHALTITNVVPSHYQVSTFNVGTYMFVDRTYSINQMPTPFAGFLGIRTANDDKDKTVLDFHFTINEGAYIYLCLKDGLTPFTGFTDTNYDIGTTDGNFSVYRKYYSAGVVSLGPKPGAGNGTSMYFILAGAYVADKPMLYTLQYETVSGRQYYRYIPAGYTPSVSWPLVVSSHGTYTSFTSGPDYPGADMSRWDVLAPPAIVICPFFYSARSDMWASNAADDDLIVKRMVEEVAASYNIDRDNIMLTGWSGGGYPTHYIGNRNPDYYRCIVPRKANFVSSLVTTDIGNRAKHMPVYMFRGQNDLADIYEQFTTAVQWYGTTIGYKHLQYETLAGEGHSPAHEDLAWNFFNTLRNGYPLAKISIVDATPPRTVRFSGLRSYDRDGSITSYAWNFGAGGNSSLSEVEITFPTNGPHDIMLQVEDNNAGTKRKGWRQMRLDFSIGVPPYIDLGTTDACAAITHPMPSDGDTIAASIGGRDCRRNLVAGSDNYFYFQVDDGYAYQGSKPNLDITIDYYDTGTGSLVLQYDAASASYKSGTSVTLTGSNTWKQYTFQVTDAYFGNRQNYLSDLRIAKTGGGNFYLDVVKVAVTTADLTPPSVPSNPAATAKSPSVVRLTWNASTDNFGVAGYRIFRNGSLAGTSSTTEYTDASLTPVTTYSYRVAAYDAAGNESAQSSPSATVTTMAACDLTDILELSDSATVGLASKAVTAIYAGSLYVEETDRNAGIRIVPVQMPHGLMVGTIIDAGGVLRTEKGERCIDGATVTIVQ
jgi:chitodextrinase